MNTKSQTYCALKWMKRYGSITAEKAYQNFGCSRLAARINDLKKQGHRIATTMVRSGHSRFASYRLIP
jgi:hypothetical protein